MLANLISQKQDNVKKKKKYKNNGFIEFLFKKGCFMQKLAQKLNLLIVIKL
jgi:hypothetical protein